MCVNSSVLLKLLYFPLGRAKTSHANDCTSLFLSFYYVPHTSLNLWSMEMLKSTGSRLAGKYMQTALKYLLTFPRLSQSPLFPIYVLVWIYKAAPWTHNILRRNQMLNLRNKGFQYGAKVNTTMKTKVDEFWIMNQDEPLFAFVPFSHGHMKRPSANFWGAIGHYRTLT